jgi:hypothetical protein
MPTFEADDFAAINAGMRELRCEEVQPSTSDPLGWYCPNCQDLLSDADIYLEFHDRRTGGCGHTVYPRCDRCDNGGWVQVYSPRPPAFGVCPDCGNLSDNPSP